MKRRGGVSIDRLFAPLLACIAMATSVHAEEASAPKQPKDQKKETPSEGSTDRQRIRYVLEGIELRGNVRTAGRVILRYVKFRAGDLLDVGNPEVELTRYRLLGTGFFSRVDLSLHKGSRRGAAVLVVEVVERNTLIVENLTAGVAADEDTAGNARPISPFLGLQLAETNLAGTGITLGAGVAIAADQYALSTRFVDPSFVGTGWSAAATLYYSDARDFFGNRSVLFEAPSIPQREVTDYAVVAYRRFGATVGTGHDLGVASSFALDYHFEQINATVPVTASHIRGNTREPILFSIEPGKSVLSELHGAVTYDTRDAPFLTVRGTLAQANVTISAPGSDYTYQSIDARWRRWFSLPRRHVLRLEGFAGFIAGDAPFFRRFYVGDFTDLLPDRLLDLAPDRRQPPNFLNTDIVEVRYGDVAAKVEAEYRIPLYVGRESVYGVDFFGSLGVYSVATRREFTNPASGYRGFRQVPIDLTGNVGLRIDTKLGGITLAFSNLIGLIAPRNGERK
ncbi:MAG TPA: BamA/TamA family outer membrane protein [Polyangium sp.]|nr:BamA/TamA family outer membrane protein [Polyangium sp.]